MAPSSEAFQDENILAAEAQLLQARISDKLREEKK
jgi:hypothetical protein